MPHELLAQAWFILLGLIVVVAAVIGYWRGPYRPAQWILLFLDILLTRFLWRLTIPRKLPIPENRGAVIIANHRSSIDPFFIQVIAPRAVHWMVAREYCVHPYFRWFLKQTEAIPTGRGGVDTAATRMALRYASEGGLVGMFPEGRINTTDQFMLPVRPGAIMVALRARVPVIPCYIEGSPYRGTAWSPLVTPARVKVKFGQPIDLSRYWNTSPDADTVRQILSICVGEIARLANRRDFQPQMAGRAWKPQEDSGGM